MQLVCDLNVLIKPETALALNRSVSDPDGPVWWMGAVESTGVKQRSEAAGRRRVQ